MTDLKQMPCGFCHSIIWIGKAQMPKIYKGFYCSFCGYFTRPHRRNKWLPIPIEKYFDDEYEEYADADYENMGERYRAYLQGLYRDYIKSAEWRERSRCVIRIRGRECQRCGFTKELQAHHKVYSNMGSEEIDDLEVLCKKCHFDKHDDF